MKHITAGLPVMLGTASAALAELVAGWVRVIVLVSGGVITLMVGYYLWRRRRYEAITARMEMCRVCQEMNGGPRHCSVATEDRPPRCPANDIDDLLPH